MLTKIKTAFLTSFLFLSTYSYAANPHYTIVVDAGSSGSRLHLFQYENEKSLPIIKDIFTENTSPGLSSFADTPSEAGKSLKKLLDDAAEKLTSMGITAIDVPINVMATAGMRLLPSEKQQAIHDNVTTFIKTNYSFPIANIATITGKMEGIYGWLDVNYLLNNFNAETDITKGTIDMGGASTQIVFSTNVINKSDDQVTLHIADKHYLVFSKSFNGMGQDQIRNTINQSENGAACYPAGYTYSSDKVGNFNFDSCGKNYLDFFTQQHIQEQLMSTNKQNFVAFSGSYYTTNFFGVDKTPEQMIVEKRIQNVCGETWEQLKKDYPTQPEKYLSAYCSNGVYVAKLLFDTYQIDGRSLTITNKIDGNSIDWTLGAVLYQLIV